MGEKGNQSKSNTNSLKSKRPSKKFKHPPQAEISKTEEGDDNSKVPVKLTLSVSGMEEPTDDSWMSEEIQCLVEDPLKKVDVSSKTEFSAAKHAKGETLALSEKTVEMTDNWMDDGNAMGSMDSDDEEEKMPTIEENKIEEPKEIRETNVVKPPGIALPITEITEDWMDDCEAIGSMDSDEDEKVEPKIEDTKEIEQRKEAVKPFGIALPITEMTEDWMDEGDAMGSMDSEEEEEVEQKIEEKNEIEQKKEAVKPAGIALPITEMTEDWMDDGGAMGSMDSDDEEESESRIEEKKEIEVMKEAVKPAGIALPISEMTEDWMDDCGAMGSMDSDEEEESEP